VKGMRKRDLAGPREGQTNGLSVEIRTITANDETGMSLQPKLIPSLNACLPTVFEYTTTSNYHALQTKTVAASAA